MEPAKQPETTDDTTPELLPPPSLRPSTGWFLYPFKVRERVIVETQIEVDEELWLVLRHPAEVPTAGLALLRRHIPSRRDLPDPELRPAWEEFRAYIRQAENFYRGAKVLQWKSAPVNYYYAFLNLAKAWCVLADRLPPRAEGEPRVLKHGLSARVMAGASDVWRLTVSQADDVFPMLYQLSIGKTIEPGAVFDVRDLLGYCLSIGWQLGDSGHENKIRSFAARWVGLSTDKHLWDLIAIFSRVDLTVLPTFSECYEELPSQQVKLLAREALGLHALALRGCRFYQRRQPFVNSVPDGYQLGLFDHGLAEALPHAAFEFTAHADAEILICLPLGAGATAIPMSEHVAIYATMHFLSTLVRYHPDYMEVIAASSDAWLVESFVKSAPLAFLRQMMSRLLGYTLVMLRR